MNRSSTTPSAHADDRDLSDESLIRASRTGDETAWRELVRRFAPLVYSIPTRYGMDESNCDDVFQEVFATLLAQLGQLRDVKRLPKWLITTTHRITWRIAREQPRSLSPEYVDLPADEPPPELMSRWERQHQVRDALSQLDGRCRTLLTVLFRTPDTPDYDAVARELDMPKGSIGPTRARCLERLLRILQSMDIEL